MSLALLGVLLLLAVLFSAWRRGAWATAGLAVCLGVVVAGSNGPFDDFINLALNGVREVAGALAKALF